MKIVQILPELDIGGVERHVIDLSNELAERGHDILVVSNGGQMQHQLSSKIQHRNLPVHKKNLFTVYFCSRKIATWVKNEGWELIHAHSRVPAWIAWFASCSARVPWIYTAHACYSLNFGLTPLRHANSVISVSETVQKHLIGYLPLNKVTVQNALPNPSVFWAPGKIGNNGAIKFLFVGRLTEIKGLQTVIEAFGRIVEHDWTLDVLGDGPMADELKKLARGLGIVDKIMFHGYSDQSDEYMAKSDCLLFPSYSEGMPLTLIRAVQVGIPVIASSIPPVIEIAGPVEGFLPPGDIEAWSNSIISFMNTKTAVVNIPISNIPTFDKMICNNELIYFDLVNK